MYFLHLEAQYILPFLIGGFIVFFSLGSLIIKEKFFLSETLIALLFGILIGPQALNLINPLMWSKHQTVTLEVTRYIIAIQVMAAGVYLPKKYLWIQLKSLVVLLIPVMFSMWLISAAIIYALLPLSYLESMVIAACITPTDPVLANSIVKGKFAEKYVPIHVRDIISAESGANDGLGFPFLFLAIFLMHYENTGQAIGYWIGLVLCYQILLSIIIGSIVGFTARKLLKFAEKQGYIDNESLLAFWLSLALFLMGGMAIIGSDDLFCCFIAGNIFTWDDWFTLKTKESHLQEVIDMLLNLSYFIYLGTVIPWKDFSLPDLGIVPWRLILIGLLIVCFRRIPPLLLAKPYIPALKSWREAIFTGWFGPIGAGTIFYAIVAIEELETYDKEYKVTHYIFPVATIVVICSIVIHGITIPLFFVGKHVHSRSFNFSNTSTAVNSVNSNLPKVHTCEQITIQNENPLHEIADMSDTTHIKYELEVLNESSDEMFTLGLNAEGDRSKKLNNKLTDTGLLKQSSSVPAHK